MNEKRELISAPTRDAFRDAAVSLFKQARVNCFERLRDSGIQPIGLPCDRAPTIGELLEGFYAAVDWTDRRSIEPFVSVFEELFHRVPNNIWSHREELTERLFRDGL